MSLRGRELSGGGPQRCGGVLPLYGQLPRQGCPRRRCVARNPTPAGQALLRPLQKVGSGLALSESKPAETLAARLACRDQCVVLSRDADAVKAAGGCGAPIFLFLCGRLWLPSQYRLTEPSVACTLKQMCRPYVLSPRLRALNSCNAFMKSVIVTLVFSNTSGGIEGWFKSMSPL